MAIKKDMTEEYSILDTKLTAPLGAIDTEEVLVVASKQSLFKKIRVNIELEVAVDERITEEKLAKNGGISYKNLGCNAILSMLDINWKDTNPCEPQDPNTRLIEDNTIRVIYRDGYLILLKYEEDNYWEDLTNVEVFKDANN